MMMSFILICLTFIYICNVSMSFQFQSSLRKYSYSNRLTMEYIPDGLSKKQWEELKRKEAEELKGKDLAKVGITKFQSRSFEAWQKSGGKNLFPVDPNSPDYEKPYMQRKGGSFDGTDLQKKGLQGVGFAAPSPKNEADLKYEKQGTSTFNLPWTSESLKTLGKKETKETKSNNPSTNNKNTESTKTETKKKGFFGLF